MYYKHKLLISESYNLYHRLLNVNITLEILNNNTLLFSLFYPFVLLHFTILHYMIFEYKYCYN